MDRNRVVDGSALLRKMWNFGLGRNEGQHERSWDEDLGLTRNWREGTRSFVQLLGREVRGEIFGIRGEVEGLLRILKFRVILGRS